MMACQPGNPSGVPGFRCVAYVLSCVSISSATLAVVAAHAATACRVACSGSAARPFEQSGKDVSSRSTLRRNSRSTWRKLSSCRGPTLTPADPGPLSSGPSWTRHSSPVSSARRVPASSSTRLSASGAGARRRINGMLRTPWPTPYLASRSPWRPIVAEFCPRRCS